MPETQIFAFDDYELDSNRKELRKTGEIVELEPKAFDLLRYLLTNRERAVGKDELSAEVWPNTIVTETALTRCVMKARRAINDSAGEQRLIKTVHGHGYAFVGELIDRAAAAQSEEAVAAAQPERARRHIWPTLGMALAAVAVVVSLGWYLAGERVRFTLDGSALAVLPIIDSTGEDELSWTSLGLMSLMNRMATDAGIATVGDQAVLNALTENPTRIGLSSVELDILNRRLGAGLVLTAVLDKQAGLYELTFQLTQVDGREVKRVMVGDSPAALAADAIAVIGQQINQSDPPSDRALQRVSEDPFINEAYARALDLELQGHYGQARDLFRAASQQAPDVFWLRYEIALCTRELGELDLAEDQLDALLGEARDSADIAAEVAVLNSLGVTALVRQRFSRAREVFNRALDLVAEGAFPARRATLHLNLALVARNLDEPALARAHMEKSLISFAEAGMEATPSLLNNFAGLLMREGDLDAAREYAQQAVGGFRLRNQRVYEAYSLNRLGKILRRQGDYAAAEQRHLQAKAIHEDVGNARGAAIAASALSSVYKARGELSRAAANAEAVIVEARAIEQPLLVADSYMQLAQIASLRQQPKLALTHYETAQRIFDASGELNGLRAASEGAALAQLRSGQLSEASDAILALRRTAQEREHTVALLRAEYLQAEWLTAAGRQSDALTLLAKLREQLTGPPASPLLLDADVLAARLLIESGDADAAQARLVSHPSNSDWETIRQRAHLAKLRGQHEIAGKLMADLALQSAEAFTEADQRLLEDLNSVTQTKQ